MYGLFSYAKIPEMFDLVMGVSGTLEQLNDEEKKIIFAYHIEKITFCASVYGESRLHFHPQTDVCVVDTEKEWMRKIAQSAQDKIAAGGAVVVVFGTPAILRDFERAHAKDFDSQRFQRLTESSDYKSNIIRRASRSQMMTVITRPFARGSDFACHDAKTRAAGGVTVIQAFMSESAAEEIQVKGRTARQGLGGSYQMVLLREDVINEGITNEELERARDQNALYHLLTRRRDEKRNETVLGLVTGQQLAREEHEKTMELYGWLWNYSKEKNDDILSRILYFNVRYDPVGSRSVYIALDDSGSTKATWKEQTAAVTAFIVRRIEMCNQAGVLPSDLVTIVNYSHDAKVMCESVPLAPSVVDHTVHRGGGTDFKAGLDMIYSQMAKASTTNKLCYSSLVMGAVPTAT